jgi:hypothetical protein
MDTGASNSIWYGNNGSYGFIYDIKDADPSIYHPHDVLILKHFPHTDLTSRSQYRTFLNVALNYEEAGTYPPHKRWTLPQPRPREELEAGVEEWRSKILHTIDTRLALYGRSRAMPSAVYHAIASDTNLPPATDRTHRALRVNEILEQILRRATPNTQYQAWNVSKAWRDTVAYILKSQHRSPVPCSPVEYNQLVDSKLRWLQASEEELVHIAKVVQTISQRAAQYPVQYFSARFTQAHELPEPTFNAIGALVHNELQWHGLTHPLRDEGPRWLDF